MTTMTGVRCPQCGNPVARWLEGRAEFICRKCKLPFVVDTRVDTRGEPVVVSSK